MTLDAYWYCSSTMVQTTQYQILLYCCNSSLRGKHQITLSIEELRGMALLLAVLAEPKPCMRPRCVVWGEETSMITQYKLALSFSHLKICVWWARGGQWLISMANQTIISSHTGIPFSEDLTWWVTWQSLLCWSYRSLLYHHTTTPNTHKTCRNWIGLIGVSSSQSLLNQLLQSTKLMILTFVAIFFALVEWGGRFVVVERTSGDWQTLRTFMGAVAANGDAAVRLYRCEKRMHHWGEVLWWMEFQRWYRL